MQMIGRMLSIEFPGLDIIRQQLNGAVVVAEYRNDPAIELRTPKDAPPLRGPDGKLPTGALPVELITPQGEDGAIVGAYLLLHEGRLAFLELYRMDAGEHISESSPPSPDRFDFFELHSPGGRAREHRLKGPR